MPKFYSPNCVEKRFGKSRGWGLGRTFGRGAVAKRPLCPSSGLIEEPLWRLSGIFQTVSEGNTSEVRGLSRFSKLRSASTTNNKDVRCGTEQTGLRFYSSNGFKKCRAPSRVFEPRVEVGQDPARALDPHERFDQKASLGHFVAQFFGDVEVSCREPPDSSGRVTVLPFANVTLDDALEDGIFQEASEQTALGGGEARDRRGREHASRANDTASLSESLEAVLPGG